jgi:hypothetical protein
LAGHRCYARSWPDAGRCVTLLDDAGDHQVGCDVNAAGQHSPCEALSLPDPRTLVGVAVCLFAPRRPPVMCAQNGQTRHHHGGYQCRSL